MPGYSSFKQYNLAFLILKDTYHYFDRIEEKEKAIKAVINAQNDPMRWRYATWQMKVNLIYDMRHEERGFGGYSLEERGQAVLDVLESARHGEEFGKIINGLVSPERYFHRDKVEIKKILTKNQLSDWFTLQHLRGYKPFVTKIQF